MAMDVVRHDGSTAARVPIDVDWGSAIECVRFHGVRRGWPPDRAFELECTAAPIWHGERGRPFVDAVRLSAGEGGDLGLDFPVGYLEPAMRASTARLVAEGTLREGEYVRCLPLAEAAPPSPPRPAAGTMLVTRTAAPCIPVREGAVSALLGSASPSGADENLEDPPVFLPAEVLDEAGQLAHGAARCETGGILVGHLYRDDDLADAFVRVTGQIPAGHTEADLTKLTFTSETWADLRVALALRGRHEIMLGWWHSHPVRAWCSDCPPERQRECVFALGFLSEHDRALHRTLFPRAYSLALVVNDVATDGPTFTLFGWRRGLLERRGFHTLGGARPAGSRIPAAPAASPGDQPHACSD